MQALHALYFRSIVGIAVLVLLACDSPCNKRLIFETPEQSSYVLPYPVDTSHYLSQTYCSNWGHSGRLAYDFKMRLGEVITASRGGTVVETKAHYSDRDHTPGHNNRVLVKHSDGSIAWYAHLQESSIFVSVGDSIGPGDTLGLCGQSGRSGNILHLHFEVFASRPYDYSDAIPITFRNISNSQQPGTALKTGIPYIALVYQ